MVFASGEVLAGSLSLFMVVLGYAMGITGIIKWNKVRTPDDQQWLVFLSGIQTYLLLS